MALATMTALPETTGPSAGAKPFADTKTTTKTA